MPKRTPQKGKAARVDAPKYMAFLSYCHKDNDTDHDWIRQAGEQLEKEVRSLVGFDFPIFIDALDTPAGRWKVNHNDVLDTAQFLIPFVTPCFLKSKPCRREVRRYHRRKNKGTIVPVFYIGTNPETDEERRTQRTLDEYEGFQWRELREKCHAVGTAKVRRELRRLAAFVKDACRASPAPLKVVVHADTVRRVVVKGKPGVDKVAVGGREMTESVRAKSGLQFTGKNKFGFDEYHSPIDGAEMVKIPAGEFKMGSTESNKEKPVHEVTLRDFCIDKYLVTNVQYRKFCDATGRDYPPDPDFLGMSGYFTSAKWEDYPVVNVSWDDARAYGEWAGKRLPTEAEWEKAARGTDGRKYPWGSTEPDGSQCNFADKQSGMDWADKAVDDGFARTSPVKQYPAGTSPFGVMDMAGNVWEWCNDWYAANYYKKSPAKNPSGPETGSDRVLRGGSWAREAADLRCAYRYWCVPSYRLVLIGFRCAVDV